MQFPNEMFPMDPDYTESSILIPESVHIIDLYLAFSDAFGDYRPQVALTLSEFRQKFFVHYQTDKHLSRIAMVNGEIAAFILSTSGSFHGKSCTYLSAVGVRSNYRGLGLMGALFDDLIVQLRKEQFELCLLEVLSSNERAISIFKSKGFTETRRYIGLNGPAANIKAKGNYSIILKNNLYFPFHEEQVTDYVNFQETPSFMRRERKRLVTLLIRKNEKEIGFMILNPVSGRIRHIYVHPEFRRKGAGTGLIQYAMKMTPKLKIINVDQQNESLINFLQALGFRSQLEQLEMTMELK